MEMVEFVATLEISKNALRDRLKQLPVQRNTRLECRIDQLDAQSAAQPTVPGAQQDDNF